MTAQPTAEPFDGRLEQEGRELVRAATGRGLVVRNMGGIGIRLLLADRYPAVLARTHGDLDVLTTRRDAAALEALLAERGWQPATAFNALNGARRMLFHDPRSPAQVDVFVEQFEMCHRLPLAGGLPRAPELSLAASDLLMTKLQIVQFNAKDRNDCYALLAGCPVDDGSAQSLDTAAIAEVTRGDWGTHHTFELNLERLERDVAAVGLSPQQVDGVLGALTAIRQAMDAAPKSRNWRWRARIGERTRWYDEPEEVDRD